MIRIQVLLLLILKLLLMRDAALAVMTIGWLTSPLVIVAMSPFPWLVSAQLLLLVGKARSLWQIDTASKRISRCEGSFIAAIKQNTSANIHSYLKIRGALSGVIYA